MAAPSARRSDPQDQHARDRAIMVTHHFEARGISDPAVLAAMGEVPREAFVSEPLSAFARNALASPMGCSFLGNARGRFAPR